MNNEIKTQTSGIGSVLPAGTLPTVSLNGVAEIEVEIDSLNDGDGLMMIKVKYPDGFEKNHQANSVEELLGKVTNQLRGRYGVTTFAFDGIPDALESGQIIKLKEVVYDT